MNSKNNSFIIPKRILLETVHGCNARCTMCPAHRPSKRKKGVMSFDTFKYVINEMRFYKEDISMMDLFGMGEPLLDKDLPNKIAYANKKGFRNIAIATNGDLLSRGLVTQLYKAGLDTIIFSIDGVQKETHEAIRINTKFERVVDNAKKAIALRDDGSYATRFVFRFIRQESNLAEWEAYREYWGSLISKEKGDKIIGYDMHTWGGEVNLQDSSKLQKIPEAVPCHHLFDRLIVLWDGTVAMCCADMHNADYAYGNVRDASPLEVFNARSAQKNRTIHSTGKRLSMKICAECTILESEAMREVKC